MLKYLTFLLLVCPWYADAQCLVKYHWVKNTQGEIIDTNLTGPFHYGNKQAPEKINFDDLITKIKIPRFPKYLEEHIIHLKDSFSKVNSEEAKREIALLESELRSTFQVLSSDSIAYALYSMDTVEIDRHQIYVYQFSTNFSNEWNEDFNNFTFYYTKQHGIIDGVYIEIWGNVYATYALIENSCLNNQAIAELQELRTYLRKKK